MDTDNEKPRPPQGGSSEPSMDTDKMYADDDDESPSEDGEPSIYADEIFIPDDEPPMLMENPSAYGGPSMSPSRDGEPAMDTYNWRSQLAPDSRQRIVDKIMETLKRHLPFSGREVLQELKKIAVRFEEMVYTTATSQADYLRKISLKMLTMEAKSQNTMANSLQSNSDGSFLTELVPIFLYQSSEVPTLDSTAPARHANGADWQEEVYQTIKRMKQAYVPELSELHQKIATRLQQFDSLPQQPKSEKAALKMFKTNLEHIISVLQISKSSISPDLKDKLVLYEKQIVNFRDRGRKPVSSVPQVQLLTPHVQPMQQSLSEITQQQFYERNPQLQSMNL